MKTSLNLSFVCVSIHVYTQGLLHASVHPIHAYMRAHTRFDLLVNLLSIVQSDCHGSIPEDLLWNNNWLHSDNHNFLRSMALHRHVKCKILKSHSCYFSLCMHPLILHTPGGGWVLSDMSSPLSSLLQRVKKSSNNFQYISYCSIHSLFTNNIYKPRRCRRHAVETSTLVSQSCIKWTASVYVVHTAVPYLIRYSWLVTYHLL